MSKLSSHVPGLEKGRCVGLTEEAATTFTCMARSYGQKNGPIDWHKRRGIVVRVSVETDNVYIQWDDRKSLDCWPLKAIVGYSRPTLQPEKPSPPLQVLYRRRTKPRNTTL